MNDNIKSPSHYTYGGLECIDAIRAVVKGMTAIEGVYTANVLKYIWRWKVKNGVEDLRKARQYLDWLIEEVEG